MYAGVKVLSATAQATAYSIDIVSGGNGGIDMYNGFDSADKYTSLSTNRLNAGIGGTGNDVAQVVSTGPFTVLPNDSVHFAFAILAGDSLLDLQTSAVNAQMQYDAMNPVTSITDNREEVEMYLFPNPVSSQAILKVNATKELVGEVAIFNVLGEQLIFKEFFVNKGQNTLAFDVNRLANGIYTCQLHLDEKKYSMKMIVSK
jgi:hypothetical protein